MPSHRIERFNEDLRRELATLIRELKDPRIESLLSVMRVDVTSDLSYAKVYIGSLEGFEKAKTACEVLKKHAGGHLRSEVSKRLQIRKIPELRFLPDDSSDYYNKINDIIEGFKD